jgi:hypothetical protein
MVFTDCTLTGNGVVHVDVVNCVSICTFVPVKQVS